MTSSSNTKPRCARAAAVRRIARKRANQTCMPAPSIRYEGKVIAVTLRARSLHRPGTVYRRLVLDHLAPRSILPDGDLVGHSLQDGRNSRKRDVIPPLQVCGKPPPPPHPP